MLSPHRVGAILVTTLLFFSCFGAQALMHSLKCQNPALQDRERPYNDGDKLTGVTPAFLDAVRDLYRVKESSYKDEKISSFSEIIERNISEVRWKVKYRDCGLTDAEIFSIKMYTGDFFSLLNPVLRMGTAPKLRKWQPVIGAINSGLAKLSEYKGTALRVQTMTKILSRQYCVGCIITMKAFTSTTLLSGIGDNDTVLEIKSKRGRYIAPLSTNEEEEEVLFRTGTKFKVLFYDRTHGKYTLEEIE
jgi:hypothetical protein